MLVGANVRPVPRDIFVVGIDISLVRSNVCSVSRDILPVGFDISLVPDYVALILRDVALAGAAVIRREAQPLTAAATTSKDTKQRRAIVL